MSCSGSFNQASGSLLCRRNAFSSVQSLSRVSLFETPWIAARQASLSITKSQSLLKPMSIESAMPSNISSSVIPFPSCPQSFPASGSFQVSQFFASSGQSSAYIFHLLGFSSMQSLKTLLTESPEAEAWSGPKAVLLFLGCSSLGPAPPPPPPFPDQHLFKSALWNSGSITQAGVCSLQEMGDIERPPCPGAPQSPAGV